MYMYIYIYIYLIDISSFQNMLNNSCCSTGFYFASKFLESSREMQILFVNIWVLFFKIYLFEVATFSFA